ncbi:MAG TPA: efflux RND transporter periplasmic adaptor subunit [Azospirillaceae bacterium]|nr:efflux RND transporter periplasmic adaptor subunit [Azospirillaceae bacterium]
MNAAGRVLALLLLPALAACGEPQASPGAPARPAASVAVAPVQPAPRAGMVKGTGMVVFKREVPLSFKVSGRISAFEVDISDTVTRGQRLAVIDQAEIAAQLREAEVAVAKAEQDLARLVPLLDKGFVQRQRVDDARSALQAARAKRDAVAFNRSLSEIEAPADGVVLVRHLEPGEIVPAGTAVLTIGDRDSGYIVRVGLADRDVGRVAVGAAAEVMLDGAALPARVTRIAAKSDRRSGVYDVELKLDAPPERVSSGRVVTVRIQPTDAATAQLLAIPTSAILEGFGSEASVFVVDPRTRAVSRRTVRVAGLEGGDTLVAGGLAAGEQVVSKGAAYLRAGDVVEAAAPAVAPAVAEAR